MAALLGLVAIKAALSLAGGSVPFALSYSGISYLLLLLLATGFSIRNAIHSELSTRPFWVLLAAGLGLWSFHQFLDLYYEVGLGIEVPDKSIADELLFLHLVPITAAVASLPHLPALDERKHLWKLNVLLILVLWAFLYGFLVSPYKYFPFDPRNYGVRYDGLYLLENLVLIVMLGVVALRARPPWKRIYFHLFGASTLYALSSTVANIAADTGGYVNGKLYGVGLTASVCWFVWIPLSARLAPNTEIDPTRSHDNQDSQVSKWAMLSVVLIPVPMIWELFLRNENAQIRTIRLTVATAAMVFLSANAYLREFLDRRELESSFNRRLIQAQEEEKVRIARELHDDVAQRVAILAIQLDQVKNSLNGQSDDTLHQLSKMQEESIALSKAVHYLSHEMHSVNLQLLGLSAAMSSWCNEFGRNRKIEILFQSHDVPARLSSEVSLHLYRVLQEALNNAAKHSGGESFNVRLWGTQAEIHLSITDLGNGFDTRAAMSGSGLGLKTMRERVKLMKGHFEIESKANRGTRIQVRVPVDSNLQPSQRL
jgi:signal transduction histidine kinase